MTFRASAKGEWLRSRTVLCTSGAREGPGEGCPSKGVISGTSSCKVSFKEASLVVECPPDPADIFFLPIFFQHFPLRSSNSPHPPYKS